MFGDKRCNDEFAHKSASSEILGWRTCFFSPIKLFSFPLVALTQFRGLLVIIIILVIFYIEVILGWRTCFFSPIK